MALPEDHEEREEQGPVIRDKRRVDPDTGAVREPVETPAPGAAGVAEPSGSAGPTASEMTGEAMSDEQAETVATQLAERTADLQRLQAEYANYRKRVERDRVAVREQALASVLGDLLPVLDDIGRAREHGELTGGFRSVAESLESTMTKLGLERFGEKGEAFDPNVHEALMHSYSSEVTEPTCVEILQPGYTVAERVLRPARVAVAEPTEEFPTEDSAGSSTEAAGAGGEQDSNDDQGSNQG